MSSTVEENNLILSPAKTIVKDFPTLGGTWDSKSVVCSLFCHSNSTLRSENSGVCDEQAESDHHFNSGPKTEPAFWRRVTFFPNLVQPRGLEASILQQQKMSHPEDGGPRKPGRKPSVTGSRSPIPTLGAGSEPCWGADAGPRWLWGVLMLSSGVLNMAETYASSWCRRLIPSVVATRFLGRNQPSYLKPWHKLYWAGCCQPN